ncbi:MAG TPA: universal stress protein [Terriglobales bacterium]|nr:universal stress protein [Terriglobales bacterium]
MNILEEKTETAVELKNLLFATDFSDASQAALPYVTALSVRYGSTIHLVHVLPEVTFLRPGAPDPAVMGSIYEDAHSDAQEKIQRISDRLKGFSHMTHVRHGEICEVLSEIIKEQKIDLVVAGTHGRTGLGKLVMGSVAEQILRATTCPVLTVGPKVVGTVAPVPRRNRELPPARINIRQILYATDFKQESLEAVGYAVSLAREFRARLALLHVIEDYGDHLHEHPGPIDGVLQKLQELVSDDSGLRYPPEILAQFGLPAESILQAASEREADLIVLGVRPANGHMGAATHLGRAVSHKVIVGATCPVLTVRS